MITEIVEMAKYLGIYSYLVVGFCWAVYSLQQQEKYFPDAHPWNSYVVYWSNLLFWPAGMVMAYLNRGKFR